jgi:CRISPR-associated protein Cmr5
MSVHTRSQGLAQTAFARIAAYGVPDTEYVTFAKKFPALIHTCGLAQAVAFALAKKESRYLGDLAAVLRANGHSAIINGPSLDESARTQQLGGYLRLSRDTISAASWLKRYVEAAVGEGE